jgi:hypothetical protein
MKLRQYSSPRANIHKDYVSAITGLYVQGAEMTLNPPPKALESAKRYCIFSQLITYKGLRLNVSRAGV